MATVSQERQQGAFVALVLVIAAAIFLNYVDRGSIGIAAPLMKAELGLSATRFGVAVSAFFWVYVPIQLLIGRLCDRWPVYRVYGAGVALWAASTFLTSFVGGLTSLIVLRALLGLGESVAFPGSSKMIARHVPANRRGAANAAISAAIAIGPAAGTLAGGLITASYGWRPMFLVFGLATFIWLLPWRAMLRQVAPAARSWGNDCVPVSQVTRRFAVWAMGIGHLTNNYGFYFLLTWLPLFLVQRGYSLVEMSYLATISYIAQAIAAVVVGWTSDRLSADGRSEGAVRRGMIVFGQLLQSVSIIGILWSESTVSLGLWLIMAGIGSAIGSVNLYAMAQIFAGSRASGTWVGVQNSIGNLSGIVGPVVTGMVIDWSGGYAGGFWLAAAVGALGVLWWAFVLPPIRPIDFD